MDKDLNWMRTNFKEFNTNLICLENPLAGESSLSKLGIDCYGSFMFCMGAVSSLRKVGTLNRIEAIKLSEILLSLFEKAMEKMEKERRSPK